MSLMQEDHMVGRAVNPGEAQGHALGRVRADARTVAGEEQLTQMVELRGAVVCRCLGSFHGRSIHVGGPDSS